MSIYGDMLSVFPELMQKHQIFTMTPLAGGGYKDRVNLYKKRGAFIKGARSKMTVQGEARVENEAGVFFCKEFKPAERTPQGVYFEYEGQIFVIADDQTYAREGGFAAYGCQLVQGSTDQQTENLNVESRTITDYTL